MVSCVCGTCLFVFSDTVEEDQTDWDDSGYAEACLCSHSAEQEEDWEANDWCGGHGVVGTSRLLVQNDQEQITRGENGVKWRIKVLHKSVQISALDQDDLDGLNEPQLFQLWNKCLEAGENKYQLECKICSYCGRCASFPGWSTIYTGLKFLTVLFNSARYTCEASSTLVKEANVGLKNKSVTGNTGQCQNSRDITLP